MTLNAKCSESKNVLLIPGKNAKFLYHPALLQCKECLLPLEICSQSSPGTGKRFKVYFYLFFRMKTKEACLE